MKTAGHSTLESMSQALWYNRWTLKKFIPFVHGNILEVGCGIGNFTPFLSQYGKLWAIDIDRDGLKRTKKISSPSIRVGFGDIQKGKYFFGKRSFDSIVCLNVLEHIEHDALALTHLYSLLSSGGYLILLVPIYPVLYGSVDLAIDHFRRYVPKKIIQTLIRVHFRIISSRKLNHIGAIGWWINGRVLKRTRISKQSIAIFNHIAPWVLPLEDIIQPLFGTSILIVAQKQS